MGDRLEQKARRNPGALRLEEVVALAQSHGFVCRRGSRGHYVCSHIALPHTVGVPSPHPDKHVKSPYVRLLLAAIDALGRAAAEEEAED